MMCAMLIAYLTVGYPTPEAFLEAAKRIGPYVSAYEIGFPPRFAKYDGPVIRRSYMSIKGSLDEHMALASSVNGTKFALTYYEDIRERPEAFISKAASSGFAGCLFPDAVIDYHLEAEKVFSMVNDAGLKNAIFVSPSVPDALISKVSRWADAFLYLGVRPTTGVPVPVSVEALVKRIKKLYSGPLIVGFGLKDEEIKDAIGAGADGIAVGTAIIKALEAGPEKAEEEVKRIARIAGN